MPVATRHQQTPLELAPPTAGETISAILPYLTLEGFSVWCQNNSGIYDPKTTHYRFNPQGRRSVPDIIGFRKRDGVFVGVEVKAGRDQLRPELKQFLDELKAAGGLAFVAHSFDQFQQSFEGRGLKRILHPRLDLLPTPRHFVEALGLVSRRIFVVNNSS